jgi:asparagine synthase (glutamine-hydrolysing)
VINPIAGVCRYSGDARHDGSVVHAMLARLGVSDAARRAVLTDGSVSVGSSLACAPVWSADRRRLLTWSGRLDNRRLLGGAVHQTDQDVVVEALTDDPDALIRVLGDFALALWCPQEARLLLARDALGVRPLYYATTPDVCWWASSLTALLVPEWLPRTINEGYLAEYLADTPVSLDETAVVGAYRVTQAHVVEVGRGQVRARRYWTPPQQAAAPRPDREVIDEVSTLVRAAVATRVPDDGPVAFQLSGGLDSSAVVGAAAAAGVQAPHTYSLVYPDVPAADESSYIDDVVRQHHCRSVRVPVTRGDVTGNAVFAPALDVGELPDLPSGELLLAPLLHQAARDGHTVMLTGVGGDEWMTGSLYGITDHLRGGRVWAAWQHARQYRSIPWLDPGGVSLWSAALAPLAPRVVARGVRRWRPGLRVPWLRPDFVTRQDLHTRMRGAFERVPPVSSFVLREALVRLTSGDSAHTRDAQYRMGCHAGIELRHPLLDRRLLECLVTLPDEYRLRNRQHRWILRQAMGGDLPPRVAARLDKPDIDHVLTDGIDRLNPDVRTPGALQIIQRGWVEPASLSQLATRARYDVDAAMVVWRLLGAEALVVALSSRGTHVPAV